MSSQHILKGLNKYGKEFPLHVDEIIKDLVTQLSIDQHQLDKTVDSLYVFDNYLTDHVQDIDESFIQATIMGLIAYIGEVYINTNGGQWKMILNEDRQTWEPKIEDTMGKLHERFFVYVYKTLAEDDYPSLRSCYLFN